MDTNCVEEELVVLESIYDDFIVSRTSSSLQLRVPVDLDLTHPGTQLIIVGQDDPPPDAVPPETFINIRYLPPLLLDITLEKAYPTDRPPEINSLESMHDWLPPSLRATILKHLLSLWSSGELVLCPWVEYLRNGEFLFGPHMEPPELVTAQPLKISRILTDYSNAASNEQHAVQSFNCPICFSSVKGSKTVLLSCSHATCHDCLKEFWTLHITEGSVDLVTCPNTECVRQGSAVKRDEVQRTVSNDMLLRWDWLREKQRADKDPGVIYCPCCQTPVFPPTIDLEDESGWSRLRNCSTCGFAFCSVCRRTWHGPISPCVERVTSEVVAEYLSLAQSDPQRQVLERRFGKAFLLRLVAKHQEDQENDRWFKASTMACPGCQVKVEKTFGCNHMTCVKCKQHFCYRCGSKINAQNPYAHFSTKGSSCFNRLFDRDESGAVDDWIPFLEEH